MTKFLVNIALGFALYIQLAQAGCVLVTPAVRSVPAVLSECLGLPDDYVTINIYNLNHITKPGLSGWDF